LPGEIKERGGGDAGTSATISDTEVARNPHQPEGWQRDGIDFFLSLLLHDAQPSRLPQMSWYSWDETLATIGAGTGEWVQRTSLSWKDQLQLLVDLLYGGGIKGDN